MAGQITLGQQGGIARITIANETKRNAMTLEMWQQLGQTIRQVEHDPAARVIVIEGAGEDAFVSGADISELGGYEVTGGSTKAYEAATAHALDALRASPKPTVALIRGYCFGAGVAIAAACDLRYARADASFSIPAARLGFGYAVHLMNDLVQCVGPARAKEILLTARRYDANRAHSMGLIHEVFEASHFPTHSEALIHAIAENAPLTLRASKLAISALCQHAKSSALTDADRAVETCFRSADAKEGRAAYGEKRKPEFTGH